MTAKEYLSQVKNHQDVIDRKLRDIKYLRQMAMSVSGVRYDGMPRNPNRPTDASFVTFIADIDEAERNLEKAIQEQIALRNDVSARIAKLENRDERLLLNYRYIDDLSWEKIEHMMHMSRSTVHRVHASALRNFRVPE